MTATTIPAADVAFLPALPGQSSTSPFTSVRAAEHERFRSSGLVEEVPGATLVRDDVIAYAGMWVTVQGYDKHLNMVATHSYESAFDWIPMAMAFRRTDVRVDPADAALKSPLPFPADVPAW